MRRALFIALLCSPLPAQRAGEISMFACQGADVASSWGRQELNPVLGTSTFGWRQASIKAGIVAGWWLATRKHRDQRAVRAGNWVIAAAGCGAAASNLARR